MANDLTPQQTAAHQAEPLKAGYRWEDFDGEISEYQGKAVTPAIKYSGSVQVPVNVETARQSEDWPNESGILKMIVQKMVAGAKSSVYQESTKDLKKTYEASPEFKRNNLIKSLVAAGKSQDEAEKLADSLMA